MNNSPLRLLVEEPNYDVNLVVEEKGPNKERRMFFEGIYMRAETPNKNKRSYKLMEMSNEVSRYVTEMVKTSRALGELNHPTSVEINPERACHIITQLEQKGNDFYGKSKILDTPMGQIVKVLMLDGVKLGVSSRALGKLEPHGTINDVSEFKLITCDVVHDPSVDTAFVDGIYEAKQYILKCNGTVCEWVDKAYEHLDERLEKLPCHCDEKKEVFAEAIMNFLNEIKKV